MATIKRSQSLTLKCLGFVATPRFREGFWNGVHCGSKWHPFIPDWIDDNGSFWEVHTLFPLCCWAMYSSLLQ